MVAAVRKNGSPNPVYPMDGYLCVCPVKARCQPSPSLRGDALVWVELGSAQGGLTGTLSEVGGRALWVEGTQGVPGSGGFMAVGGGY